MSYLFVPRGEDALDTNIHDLDSFELSGDDYNMSDAETAEFSTSSSSSLEPDTTTKFLFEDPTTQRGDSVADNTYYRSILTHPQVAKLILFLHLLM